MNMAFSWILLGLLAAMLLACCWWDLKTRTIPNSLNLAIALLAVASDLGRTSRLAEVALRVGVAFIAFWVFRRGLRDGRDGRRDVKLIAALALWLPWQAVLALLF
jgi:prepilin peptidase CpaA